MFPGSNAAIDRAQCHLFASGKSVRGAINGGGGGDWLDYGLYTTAITVDLSAGTATGVGDGISNIQNVHAGTGGSTLTGNSLGNILVGNTGHDVITGGSGRSILIGGKGSDTITGGADDDLNVGGNTNYDTNTTALLAILAEWQRTDLDYTSRIAHIRGPSGGKNGSFFFNSSTVHDDAIVDHLTGGSGMDWFWAQVSGEITDLNGEQVN